jgi:hypothetical protein
MGKSDFHYIISESMWSIWLITTDVKLDTFLKFVNRKRTYYYDYYYYSLHIMLLAKKSLCTAYSCVKSCTSTSWQVGININYLEFVCSFSFIYSCNHLFILICTHAFHFMLWVIIQYYFILFPAQTIPALTTGSFYSWLLYSFAFLLCPLSFSSTPSYLSLFLYSHTF